MDTTRPFPGAAAVRAGLATPKQLRGPRFRRVFRGVFVDDRTEDSFLLRCEAAAVASGAIASDGLAAAHPTALAGWAAAAMAGADCAPVDAPVEIVVRNGHRRPQPGLVVRHQVLLPGEALGGVRIPMPGYRRRFVPGRTVTTTSAMRSAFDLACRVDRIRAVIALDALSRVGGFAPTDVLELARRHPGARGSLRLPGLVAVASPLSESPMETRVRLALHDHGVRPPVLQHPVGAYRIDLAYPDLKLGIEYDGGIHLDPQRARADLTRQAFLTAHGWEIWRPDAATVLGRPEFVAGAVRRLLAQRARVRVTSTHTPSV